MKTKILSLIVLASLLLTASVAQAQLFITTNLAVGVLTTNVLATNGLRVVRIQVMCPTNNAINSSLSLYDSTTGKDYITNNATAITFSNNIVARTNIFTGTTGLSMTNYSTNVFYMTRITNSVGMLTNNYPALWSLVAPPGLVYSWDVDILFSRGITYKVTTNTTLVLSYYNNLNPPPALGVNPAP